MHLEEINNSRWYKYAWWLSLLCIFAVIHITNDRIFSFIGYTSFIPEYFKTFLFARKSAVVHHIITPTKAITYLVSLILLSIPVILDLRQSIKTNNSVAPYFFEKQTLLIFLILALLVIPGGVRSMGTDYADMSIAPFEAGEGWYYKRLLMPAIANLFFLQGRAFFLPFSLFFTLVFIQLTRIWLSANKITLTFVQLLSLCTSSFIFYQFQLPGYPDALMHIFLLVAVTFPLKNSSKVTLLVLAVLTHESSMFISVILAYFILDKRSLLRFYSICALYCLFWIGSYGFAPDAAVHSHQVDGFSALQWMQLNPIREFIGVLFSYKALWIFIIIALPLLWQKKEYKSLWLSVLLLLSSFGMTFLAVDTSRIMGWSFIVLLLAIKTVHQSDVKDKIKKSLNTVYIINLLIPSVYIGLNIKPLWLNGLYKVYKIVFEFFL